MMIIITALLSSILAMVAWFANDLSTTLKGIQRDINDIGKIVEHVSTAHDGLKDRVSKCEDKIDKILEK